MHIYHFAREFTSVQRLVYHIRKLLHDVFSILLYIILQCDGKDGTGGRVGLESSTLRSYNIALQTISDMMRFDSRISTLQGSILNE